MISWRLNSGWKSFLSVRHALPGKPPEPASTHRPALVHKTKRAHTNSVGDTYEAKGIFRTQSDIHCLGLGQRLSSQRYYIRDESLLLKEINQSRGGTKFQSKETNGKWNFLSRVQTPVSSQRVSNIRTRTMPRDVLSVGLSRAKISPVLVLVLALPVLLEGSILTNVCCQVKYSKLDFLFCDCCFVVAFDGSLLQGLLFWTGIGRYSKLDLWN